MELETLLVLYICDIELYTTIVDIF